MRLRLLRILRIAAPLLVGVLALSGVASALPARSSSVSPRPGRYKGMVGPFTLSFTVSENREEITKLQSSFNPAAECSIPTDFQTEHFGTLRLHDGEFSGSTVEGEATPTTYSIEGHFTSPDEVSGKMSGRFTIKSLPPCENRESFTAHHLS